jgi:PTS system mannose-specific IIB component
MKQILIATHGKMASGIRYTAELIVGKMAEITTIDAYVTPEDNVEKKFEEYFAQHENDRIFVFTDLMGGSVNQKLLGYSQKENVTLITGTNLPVLMQVMMADDDVTEEEIQEFIDDAREELQVVDLGGEKKSPAKENAAPAAEKSAPKKAPAPQSYDNSTAKITALRVDDRLIHGQVAMTWTKQLAVQGIVVANDEAANDNTQKMALKMAVPGGIKSLIKPVDEAIRILNNPKASRMRILVLTRTVKDALKIRQSVGEIGFLNVGNTGRFDGIDVSEKLVLTPTIMLTKAEQQALKDLVALEPKTCMQQVPNDEQKLVKDVLDKLN